MPGEVIIVTGAIGGGKTTYIIEQIAEALADGKAVAGIISPGMYIKGRREQIHAAEPHTGNRYCLARLRDFEPAEIQTPAWTFSEDAIARANCCLENLPQAELLFIDELGPLEFYRNQGFTAAFDVIGTFKISFVVVRESLVSEALRRWPYAEIHGVSP